MEAPFREPALELLLTVQCMNLDMSLRTRSNRITVPGHETEFLAENMDNLFESLSSVT